MRTLAISRIWVNLPPARSTSSLSVSMEPASASSSVISVFCRRAGAAGSVARTSAASLTMGCETERTVIRIVTRLVRTMDASSARRITMAPANPRRRA